MTEAENRSERPSSGRPASISGGMYDSFPLMPPVLVWWCPWVALATPKSMTLRCPVTSMRRFDGEMSRCTRPSGSPA